LHIRTRRLIEGNFNSDRELFSAAWKRLTVILSYSLPAPASKMQPRRPSTTSSLTLLNNSLRRRSSTARLRGQDNFASKVDEVDGNDTVVLRPGLTPVSSPPLPALPVFSSSSRLEDNAVVTRVTLRDGPAPESTREKPIFSPIPLVACPEAPSRAPSVVSQISRLPTPPFSLRPPSPTGDNEFLPSFSFLPSGFSSNFLSFGEEQTPPSSAPASSRPEGVRNDSGSSSSSTESGYRNEKGSTRSYTSTYLQIQRKASIYSCKTIDSGHRSLIPSIGTTDKFTHKWPTPQSLRQGKSAHEMRATSGVALSQIMEDGQGLGMEKVDKWTSFKWCLLLSVTSVFLYGGGGMVAAILTWFRGERFLSHSEIGEN
jgi:hypothetical protein